MNVPQPILAAGGVESLLGVLVMLGISFIGWVSNRMEEKRKAAPGKPRTTPTAAGRSEAEQTRKFLEALGLPSDRTAVRPPPVSSQPLRPSAQTPPRLPKGPLPAPPILARPFPKARPKPAVAVRRAEPESAGASIETFENPHLPEMRVPEVPEFHTVSSAATAIPYETYVAGRTSGPEPSAALSPRGRMGEMREMLRTPSGLRGALILREILGPPRGLQRSDFTHTFSSL